MSINQNNLNLKKKTRIFYSPINKEKNSKLSQFSHFHKFNGFEDSEIIENPFETLKIFKNYMIHNNIDYITNLNEKNLTKKKLKKNINLIKNGIKFKKNSASKSNEEKI